MLVNNLTRGFGRCTATFLTWIAVWSGSAHAAVIQSTDSFTNAGASTQTLTLDLFDPTLGNLTKVDFSIDFDSGFIASLTIAVNCTRFSCPRTETEGGSVTRMVDFSRGTIEIHLSSTATNFASCTSNSGVNFCPSRLLGTPLFGNDSATDNATLALFTGPGSFGVDFFISENGDWTPEIDGSATVTYTYSEALATVPEPASVALLGLGLVGLGVIRLKRS